MQSHEVESVKSLPDLSSCSHSHNDTMVVLTSQEVLSCCEGTGRDDR